MARLRPPGSGEIFVYGEEDMSFVCAWMDSIATHLEFSNIESIPKSETEPPEKVWFSFALVGTMGGSSRGPPEGDDYNRCIRFCRHL